MAEQQAGRAAWQWRGRAERPVRAARAVGSGRGGRWATDACASHAVYTVRARGQKRGACPTCHAPGARGLDGRGERRVWTQGRDGAAHVGAAARDAGADGRSTAVGTYACGVSAHRQSRWRETQTAVRAGSRGWGYPERLQGTAAGRLAGAHRHDRQASEEGGDLLHLRGRSSGEQLGNLHNNNGLVTLGRHVAEVVTRSTCRTSNSRATPRAKYGRALGRR